MTAQLSLTVAKCHRCSCHCSVYLDISSLDVIWVLFPSHSFYCVSSYASLLPSLKEERKELVSFDRKHNTEYTSEEKICRETPAEA